MKITMFGRYASAAVSLSICSMVGGGGCGKTESNGTDTSPPTQQVTTSNPGPPNEKPVAAESAANSAHPEPKATQEQAIATVLKHDGAITYDSNGHDKHVVDVLFKGRMATDDGLANLNVFPQLKTLEIYPFNNVTDAGLPHIAHLTGLEKLRLDGVKATDAGLVNLKGLVKLRTLEIMGTEITGSGLEYVKGLPALTTLSLSFNSQLKDAGLEHLKGMTNLKSLDLDDTKVTAAGVDKLKHALPDCHILTSLDNLATIEGRTSVSQPPGEKLPTGPSDSTSTSAGDWPQWRGPNRDGCSAETGLLQEWPEAGPPLRWEVQGLGSGYSSASIEHGKLFTMGTRAHKTYLIALDANTGKKLWETFIVEHNTIAFSTPTVDGDRVYALGHAGDLICAATSNGAEIWRRNIKQDFGNNFTSSGFGEGYTESVLIDGDRLICSPGAKEATIVCLNKMNGQTIWKAAYPPNVGPQGEDRNGFSSVVISNACGIRQYVQLGARGLISVAAKDGKTLWAYNDIAFPHPGIPTPIVAGNYVFASTAQTDPMPAATVLLKLVPHEGGVKAEEVYRLHSRVAANHHGGMVLVGDYIYMGHGYGRGFPLCLEMKTGKVAWRPGRGPGTGSASVLYADGNIYFHYENDVMALVEATPEKYVLKGQFKVGDSISGEWSHPVIAGGCLYVRAHDRMRCYDLHRQ